MDSIEEVKKFLTDHKEDESVKAFFKELIPEVKLTPELVAPFLETQDGQKLIQPITDQRVTKAIQTYKENHYEADIKQRVAAEVLKLNPTETAEQKQIRELRDAFENEKKAREKDLLKRQIVEEAARMKVDPFFVDDYLPSSLDEAKVFLGKIQKRDLEFGDRVKNEILATGFKPGSGKTEGNQGKLDLSKMTKDQIIELELKGELDKHLA